MVEKSVNNINSQLSLFPPQNMRFKLYECMLGYELSAETLLSYWTFWIEGSGTAAKVVQYEVVPCTQQRCHWPERVPGPPCVCCLDPEVPDSQSISTNEGYLIYSDTPGQDWSTLNNLRILCDILILLLHFPNDWIKLRQFHLSFGLVPDQILWIWQFLRLSKNSTNNIAVTTLKLMLRILQRNP